MGRTRDAWKLGGLSEDRCCDSWLVALEGSVGRFRDGTSDKEVTDGNCARWEKGWNKGRTEGHGWMVHATVRVSAPNLAPSYR
jgi:hypothetical protein